MQSELANLDSQVLMQQESVEAKDAAMMKIRDQIDQVVHCQCACCCLVSHAATVPPILDFLKLSVLMGLSSFSKQSELPE